MSDNKYTGKVAATVIPRTEKEEKFLIAKRSDNGDWEFPGGKQHIDESLTKTAEREIKEEFDLNVTGVEAKPEYCWNGGGYTIIPVLARHSYKDLENQIEESSMIDHDKHIYIHPNRLGSNLENAEEKLGKEIKALEAFDLL